MKDRAWLEQKRKELTADNIRRLADYHATEGAIQLLDLLLHDDEQTMGLPLERLFPGATVEPPLSEPVSVGT